ncbi:MAG: GNAT family N-acetyltransferase [Candidatus Dactylopiibacterium sp.]|nr:GNAT family N-acetyltransferase [Candidatus Dactylopiibacterium sp.]
MPPGILAAIGPLASARLALRPFTGADALALHAMTDDPSITGAVHFLPTPFAPHDALALIEGDGSGRDCFWGVWNRESGLLVGTFGTHLKGADEIEIGYWFAPGARGRGYALEAGQTLIAALRAALPARGVMAECRPANQASWRLLEKLGLRADGRAGDRAGRLRLSLAAGATPAGIAATP